MRADAVVVPTVAGQRYIVSMFGSHSGTRRVRLAMVPPEERAPVDFDRNLASKPTRNLFSER
jgi:hypothetical protein